jgi:hypothetical protein
MMEGADSSNVTVVATISDQGEAVLCIVQQQHEPHAVRTDHVA